MRSVKCTIKKSIGRGLLTRSEVETHLFEVEFCINSRPLTFVSDKISGDSPLTPNHFLLGKVVSNWSFKVEDHETISLPDMYDGSMQRLNLFWKV